jgi:predicted cupin superfamily sugar epimerase
MNKSVVRLTRHFFLQPFTLAIQTYHVLHQGRVEYTLIHPDSPPRIEKVVMGTDVAAGEQRQLLVGTGVWKMSQIPPKDLSSANTDTEKNSIGCLITEVVVPGFHWEDHQYLTKAGLRDLFRDDPSSAGLLEHLLSYVKKS